MAALHRHQLASLSPAGWERVRRRAWDEVAADCLSHWASHGLPLVVTRQPPDLPDPGGIALGLPAPARWERRRLALQVPRTEVLFFDEFPRAPAVAPLLPAAARRAWRALCSGLEACGARARVHGSFGWQHLTGLDHVHAASDIDVWIAVSDADQADAVAAQLQAFAAPRPRLDGELVFASGNAVAWREWRAWRAGQARALLVKHLHGHALTRDPCVQAGAEALAEAP
jgi:phosphoribosyl-dephospho-CoA transferase